MQTSYIVAYLVIGFLVFIVLRNEIPAYKTAVLGTSPNTGA